MKRNYGFSLFELMMTLAILGLIAAIAIPSYSQYAMKARRSEAVVMLTELAGEQYRYFSEKNQYAKKMTDLGFDADTVVTENGNYNITVSVPDTDPGSFTLTATPKAGSLQSKDTRCTEFSIDSVGVKRSKPAGTSDECW